mgnify:CR=1 FL=1
MKPSDQVVLGLLLHRIGDVEGEDVVSIETQAADDGIEGGGVFVEVAGDDEQAGTRGGFGGAVEGVGEGAGRGGFRSFERAPGGAKF